MTSASTLPGDFPTNRGRVAPAAGDPQRFDAFLPSPCIQNHAANIIALRNGDLACVWFGGTQEGIPDISVYFSRLAVGSDRWTDPVKLSNDPTRSEQNPLLFPAPDGTLWLFYTAQISGNQDTAIVRCRTSSDDGRTWGPIRTLFEGGDQDGIFIRQPLVVLPNGDWLLPVFHCYGTPGVKWVGDHDTSAVKISTDQGRTWTEHPVPDSTGCVHMSVVPLRDGTLAAFFRSRWADRVYRSTSEDQGRTWSTPVPTPLPNNNSSIQVTALRDGRLAMVFNESSAEGVTERRLSLYDDIEDDDAPGSEGTETTAPTPAVGQDEGRKAFWGAPRAPMTLALSSDGGITWPVRRNLEVGDGYCMTNNSKDNLNREFSYPSITQAEDGNLHVAFTYFRQAIKYSCVSPDWVSAGQ